MVDDGTLTAKGRCAELRDIISSCMGMHWVDKVEELLEWDN